MKAILTTLLVVLLTAQLIAQGQTPRLGLPTERIAERLRIKTGIDPDYSPTMRPYPRGLVTRLALAADTTESLLSSMDERDIRYLLLDNNDWIDDATAYLATGERNYDRRYYRRVYTDTAQLFYTTVMIDSAGNTAAPSQAEPSAGAFGLFYRTPAFLYETDGPYFSLRLNPLIQMTGGGLNMPNNDILSYSRVGLALRATIDDRVWVSSSVTTNNLRLAPWVHDYEDRYGVVPGFGFYKTYAFENLGISEGYDIFDAKGEVGFYISRHLTARLGHGQHFVGDGFRSLILSDFAPNRFYLQLDWQVGRFRYHNLFMELSDEAPGGRDRVLDKKYAVMHHLHYHARPNLRFGIFETVVLQRQNDFELQYLNPVIFYRAIEQHIGSPDNAMLGIDARWDIARRYSLYGQFMIDEFRAEEMFFDPQGWWGNKFGLQLGAKAIDVAGVDHLDVQLEYNLVRPYTYSYRDSSADYTHYEQPLAHPLEANFGEVVLNVYYQPTWRLQLSGRLIMATKGFDDDTTNWGGDIRRPSDTRERDFGNETGQGFTSDLMIARFDAAYQIRHNVFIDLFYLYRRSESPLTEYQYDNFHIGGGVRINLAPLQYDF